MTHRRKARALAWTCASIAIIATVTTPAIGADPGDAVDPQPAEAVRLLSTDEAWAVDADRLGKQQGVPAAVMAERLRFQAAAAALQDSWPATVLDESFAGGTMVWGARPRAVLYFKGSVPPVVRSQVSRAGLSGIQLVGGQRYSLNELQARHNAVHDAMVALGFRSVRSSFDLSTQRIDVSVSLDPDQPTLREPRQMRDAVIARLAGPAMAIAAEDLRVAVHPAGTQMLTLQHGYGGAGIRRNGALDCTSAFSVRRNSDGLKGYVTAAHCEQITQMEQNKSGGGAELVFSSPWVAEHIGARGEIEWHYTAHDSYPQFWDSITTMRTVSGRVANNQIYQNDYVCRYGRATPPSCGTIANPSTSFSFNWEGCGYCRVTAYDMVEVVGAVGAPGDSGGPWFLGPWAYGIHTGSFYDGGYHLVFSKIQNAEIQFGVSVMTG
jgi:hypothetical protein